MKNFLLNKTNLGFSSFVVLHFLLLTLNSSNFISNNNFIALNTIKSKVDNTYKMKIGAFELEKEDIEWIENTISSMPLYEKCAQVFMPAVFGNNLDTSSYEFKNTLDLVKNHGIGGIVISTGKISQTSTMINELQKAAKIPLLVSADFENGVGMRIEDAVVFPHNMAIGATDNPDFAYEVGKAIAVESKMLGVNINFAPVADINNNSENPVINLRSFSEDKDVVYDNCSKFVEGTNDGGIIATAKHFPGHGNTKIDSHKDLPIINGTKEYLLENEISPFKKLIDDGVKAIMIGHLSVPAFEPQKNLASSLSYNIVTKLLKDELGFEGLIITDALDMQAVTNFYDPAQAVIKAFKAGNDILLMPPDIKTGIQALYDAVKSGEITEERLDESVRKILAAKRWLKLYENNNQLQKNLADKIRIPEHISLAKEIAKESVTPVKIENGIYPINPAGYKNVLVINITNRRNFSDNTFEQAVKENFNNPNSISLTSSSKKTDFNKANSLVQKSDLIFIASYFSLRTNGNGYVMPYSQMEFLQNLLSSNKNVIFISFENPYILTIFPDTKNYICTFSNVPDSQNAALNFLLGFSKQFGSLPVTIPYTGFNIGYKWDLEN